MSNRFDGIAAKAGACLVVALVALIAITAWPGAWRAIGDLLRDQAAPAWVQAIGSIGAIGAGAVGVWWQVRQQVRIASTAKLLADIDSLLAHRDLVKYAENLLVAAHAASCDDSSYRNYATVQWLTNETQLFKATLADVEMKEIPDPGLKLAFRSARAAFGEADGFLEKAWGAQHSNTWATVMAEAHRPVLARQLEKIGQHRLTFDQRIDEWQRKASAGH